MTRHAQSVSISVLLGTLLIPLTAYAASVLIEASVSAETEAAEATTVDAPQVEPTPADLVTQDDLMAACGEVGLSMVAAETEGSITSFEQAALDALRQVCAGQGLALPDKRVTPPVAEAVPPTDSPAPAPTPQPSAVVEWEEDRDDDDWEFEVRYDLDGDDHEEADN